MHTQNFILVFEGDLYIAMDYAPYGNLKTYLMTQKMKYLLVRGNPQGTTELTSHDLITFAVQVAHGMQHITKLGVSTKLLIQGGHCMRITVQTFNSCISRTDVC